MKKIVFSAILLNSSLFSSMVLSHDCLSESERENLTLILERENAYKNAENYRYYADVPNMIQCGQTLNYLEAFVCRHKDYLDMFELISKGNVYAIENAIKREVNHFTYNEEYSQYWVKNYDLENIDHVRLCSEIKNETNDIYGDASPY